MPSQFRTLVAFGKAVIDAEGYTSAQVAGITKQQLATHFGVEVNASWWTGGNHGFFTAVLTALTEDTERKEHKVMAESIKEALTSQQKQWLLVNAADYLRHLGVLEEEE